MARLVVIDENPDTPITIALFLGGNHEILRYEHGVLAADFIRDSRPDIVFLNLDLESIDTFDLLGTLSARGSSAPVVAFTARISSRRVVAAVKHGAFDVVEAPLNPEPLRRSFAEAISSRVAPIGPPTDSMFPEIIGVSVATMRLRDSIKKFSGSRAPVLITGASGSGKELVADAIHRLSGRLDGELVALNCGAIPDTLFESELFGTMQGAFTDARTRGGALDKADGGTLFLDEIGELSPRAQVKLLRVLETKRFSRVGDSVCRSSDFRLIAATNRNLREEIAEGRFRHDLYYRLNIARLTVKPLSERQEDIPVLAQHFRQRIGRAEKLSVLPPFTPGALDRLSSYSWPGNVRELKNVIWRALLLSDGEKITPENIDFDA